MNKDNRVLNDNELDSVSGGVTPDFPAPEIYENNNKKASAQLVGFIPPYPFLS